jgi:hypothetical protein
MVIQNQLKSTYMPAEKLPMAKKHISVNVSKAILNQGG